jgi:hypothetical protein
MSERNLDSAIARFSEAMEADVWSDPSTLNSLIRGCAERLFALCRADARGWLSEGDLQSMFYAILRRELPQRGLPACAVHAGYPCRIPGHHIRELGKRSRKLPVDLGLVVPQSIHIIGRRQWEGQIVAAIEVKRCHERLREIKADLAKLATIRAAWPEVQVFMLVMGYHSDLEDIAAVERTAATMNIPLLQDNYLGRPEHLDQQELA